VPGSNCLPLAGPDAKFLRRAAFLKHNLWVTQFHPDECFPGGEFPNQNPRVGEGLPTWVKQDRKLEETDIYFGEFLELFCAIRRYKSITCHTEYFVQGLGRTTSAAYMVRPHVLPSRKLRFVRFKVYLAHTICL
jgi:hypothetical protein